MTRISKISLFLIIAMVMSLPAAARPASSHSHYVRTLQDLSVARVLLQRTAATQPGKDQPDEVKLAVASIDSAIAEINGASVTNGAPNSDAVQIDARDSWETRLAKSAEMLDRAEQDLSRGKDDSGVEGLQTRVMAQIDQARTRIRVAIETVNFNYSEALLVH